MEIREQSISPAHEATFRWILSDSPPQNKPWDNLIRWLRDDGGCYWINDKAASGKSTLMRFLIRQPEIRAALKAWAGSNELLVVPFFFWNLGTELQKSQEGLLRSVLHSILSKYRTLIAKVVPGYYNDVARNMRHTDESARLPFVEPLYAIELKLAFLRMFKVLPDNLRLCLFIDGVDEYSGEPTDIAELLRTVVSFKVKIVVSSRPTGSCVAAFEEYPKLRLQDLTRDDITSYIEARIKTEKNMQLLRPNQPEDVDRLVQEISSRSSGIFLWVVLVVKSLLQGLIEGDQLGDLRKRLYSYPRELEPLYKHMLESVHDLHRVQASRYLQIVLRSTEVQDKYPLSLLQMSFADEDDPNTVLKLPFGRLSTTEICSRCEAVGRRLVSRCCGLIEWVDGTKSSSEPGSSEVNFLHKSVIDYLRIPDTWTSVTRITAGINYDTNWTLASSCLSMLKISAATERTSGHLLLDSRLDFAGYFFTYSRDAEKSSNRTNGGFLLELCKWLSSPTERKWGQEVAYSSSTQNGQVLGLLPFVKDVEQVPTSLALAVCHHLPLHTRKQLEPYPPSYLKKEGAALLLAAVSPLTVFEALRGRCQHALEDTIKCLLENGADPNLARRHQPSPWACALSCVYLLTNWDPPSLLSYRATWAYIRICELLHSHGADVNAVIPRPRLPKALDDLYRWAIDFQTTSAFSPLAIIKDFLRSDFAESRSSSPKIEGRRNIGERLVILLEEQGAQSRRWVDGKQTEGPPIKTPLSVLLKQPSLSPALPETTPTSASFPTKSGKGVKARLKDWRQSLSNPPGGR